MHPCVLFLFICQRILFSFRKRRLRSSQLYLSASSCDSLAVSLAPPPVRESCLSLTRTKINTEVSSAEFSFRLAYFRRFPPLIAIRRVLCCCVPLAGTVHSPSVHPAFAFIVRVPFESLIS